MFPGLPVVDADGRLVGLISEADFLHRAELGTTKRKPRWIEFLLGPGETAESYVLSHGRKVGELMTRDVVTVDASASLNEIVDLMERRRIKRVPVVSGGQLVGIISRSDLVRALATTLAPKKAAAAGEVSDQAILDKLMAELQNPGIRLAEIARSDRRPRRGDVERRDFRRKAAPRLDRRRRKYSRRDQGGRPAHLDRALLRHVDQQRREASDPHPTEIRRASAAARLASSRPIGPPMAAALTKASRKAGEPAGAKASRPPSSA